MDAVNIALNRIKKHLILTKGSEYQKVKKLRRLVISYCDLVGAEVPLRKKQNKFIVSEYLREDSPIYKGIKLPVVRDEARRNRNKKKREYKERRQTYSEYLNSSKWKTFKKKLILIRGHKCERCGDEQARLDGHHVTYERLFNELPEDVLLLCRPCHKNIHNKK